MKSMALRDPDLLHHTLLEGERRVLQNFAAKLKAHYGPGLERVALFGSRAPSKAQAAEMSMRVTDLATRCCGGAAFSKHLSVERAFRDARAASVMAPTTDQLHDFLGKALLGMPLF